MLDAAVVTVVVAVAVGVVATTAGEDALEGAGANDTAAICRAVFNVWPV